MKHEKLIALFPADARVELRTDNRECPCGFGVIGTSPEEPGVSPDGIESVCILPDGMDADKARRAEVIAAIPEMLERLDDHCQFCTDCDWRGNPDQGCQFGQMWKRLRGEE